MNSYHSAIAHSASIKAHREPPVFDMEKTVEQYVAGVSTALKIIEDAMDNPQTDEMLQSIDNQARLNSDLTRLTLICSLLREKFRRRHREAAE